MEDNNKDNIKDEIEDIYAKLITLIEERINSFVFENTDTGRIFFDVLKFYNIPNSEDLMSAMLFNLYEGYQEVKNETYFDDFLNNLMTFYCELIKKYEEETTELNKTLQATKLNLDKITKKLSKKISEYDEVICYLQYELNRYEVYNDMSLTNINKKEKKPTSSTSNKIQVRGSLQSIGYLFSELINKGYIEVPKRNGNPNTSEISRMILEHFEFIDREFEQKKQPKLDSIRKTLFSNNSLSADKQALFKIPESNIINTD